MIILINSPDKLSLSMFTKFYSREINENTHVIDMHALNSIGIKKEVFNDIIKLNEVSGGDAHILIKHKSKKDLKNPVSDFLIEGSDYVFEFDIYSTHLEITKYKDSVIKDRIEARWNTYVEKLN